MDAWAGMERFLNLSLGSQVGASGVALIAVLELKRLLQNQVGYHKEPGTNTIRLTAEEWRTIAGIHERKTFERAKAKLEELGVLKIEHDGKLLEISLWPDPIIVEEEITTCDQQAAVECAKGEVVTELDSEPASEMKAAQEKGTRLRLMETPLVSSRTGREANDETGFETRSGTTSGTGCATSCETNHGTSCETETVSPSERVLRFREDEVFPKTDGPINVGPLREPLNRSSLSGYSLNRELINNNNEMNDTTKNDQRYDGKSEFATRWVEEVGHALTAYEKEGVARFLRLGYTDELCVEALRCAVAADNRQMGYVLGILRNWYQEGVRCLEDVALAKKEWDDLRFLKRAAICKA
ncbi:MAG TPA: DnaD domain protein [Desulfosporosinus sp.]